MGKNITNVLLVDDHQMMRESFRKIINRQENIAVIGEVANGEEAIKFVQEHYPDVVIMDINMPVMDGIEATRKIKRIMPETIIIGASLHGKPKIIKNMINVGASAFVSKDKVFDTLYPTIHDEVTSQKVSSELR